MLGAVFERMSENTHRLAGDFINSYLLHCAVLAALVYIGVCAVPSYRKQVGDSAELVVCSTSSSHLLHAIL